MRLSEDVPGNPVYGKELTGRETTTLASAAAFYMLEKKKPYVRVQRSKTERRARRLAGVAERKRLRQEALDSI